MNLLPLLFAVAAASTGGSSVLQPQLRACSANSKCLGLGLSGDCCPTADGRQLDCCAGSVAVKPTDAIPAMPATPAIPAAPAIPSAPASSIPMANATEETAIGPDCRAYLQAKHLQSPADLAAQLHRCTPGASPYRPNPKPDIPGATDTTNLQCQYTTPFGEAPTCCGWRPHFNWVVGTCESNPRIPKASFCDGVPSCAREPQINYAAAYQYNGSHFVLQDASTAGDLSETGVAGSFKDKTGWEAVKSKFRWEGGEGDWPTKYAPWGLGEEGPRGLTPPAALWVLSTDSFYYGTLYMLSQLTLNAQGHKDHQNCWEWEFDAIEGLLGTIPKGSSLPGNLNQLYVTATAQVSGCMPMPGTAAQGNGPQRHFVEPSGFDAFCRAHPSAVGCEPWKNGAEIWHGGGHQGTDRFENFEHTPYVFAVVLDHEGFWVYRWRPDATGATGWPGISRTHAARVLPPRPQRITDAKGLATDVRGDTREAVILIPSLPPEAACIRSTPEMVDFRWGAGALGSMSYQMDDYQLGQKYQGSQNWWAHFQNTRQLQDYPLSIAGVPAADTKNAYYACNDKTKFGRECRCEYGSGRNTSSALEPPPSFEVAMMLQKILR